ncbi:MAG: saccharopine dehydrogenase NADP-binding domain-containing protein [Balneolia bacterium]|nr:saccharopine dehydrogenase NADP-binding domain-containing protein [Balneolia bacterium]
MKAEKQLLIYGSYGYTGRLIVEECLKRKLKPVLSGRNEHKLREQAEKHNLEFNCFELNDVKTVAKHLEEFSAVLHCAGPFIKTAEVMAEACLRSKTHYLDITGEIDVFEMMASKSGKANAAGITLLPGVGFDVVPSDCLARYASEQMPDANSLKLYISFKGTFSAGSASTAIEHFSGGGKVRRNGELVSVPPAFKTERVDFGDKERLTVTIPWGDVSTSYHSTGIPNVEVYMKFPEKTIRRMKLLRAFKSLMKLEAVKSFLRSRVRKMGDGPDEKDRATGETRILARVSDDQGNQRSFLQISPEAYTLTAQTAVDCAIRVMNGETGAGFTTPSLAFGSKYILGFKGVIRESV